jgi:hypothetical protein
LRKRERRGIAQFTDCCYLGPVFRRGHGPFGFIPFIAVIVALFGAAPASAAQR